MSDILNEEEQRCAMELAYRIGQLLSEAQQPVMVSALALSLATADVVSFVRPEAQQDLKDIIQMLTRDAIDILKNKKPEPVN